MDLYITLSGADLSKLLCLTSEKGSTLKGTGISIGRGVFFFCFFFLFFFFCFFLRSIGMQGSKQKVAEVVTLENKTAENLPHELIKYFLNQTSCLFVFFTSLVTLRWSQHKHGLDVN